MVSTMTKFKQYVVSFD